MRRRRSRECAAGRWALCERMSRIAWRAIDVWAFLMSMAAWTRVGVARSTYSWWRRGAASRPEGTRPHCVRCR